MTACLPRDDGLAVARVKYAHARRLRIPKDLCIVGYNISELAVCCEPELSSIDNFAQELCGMVIDEMMGLLRGGDNAASAQRGSLSFGKEVFHGFLNRTIHSSRKHLLFAA